MLPLYQTKDFDRIRMVYLFVGPACNMHCRHCLQTPIKGNVEISFDKMNKMVLQFMENYIEHCVHSHSSFKDPCVFEFRGGEVLIYWKFVKELIVNLTAKYNILQNKNFRFRFTTNGSLLTDEIIDFLNKYEVQVVFSYDAPYPFAVRDYVSDDICQKILQLKSRTIKSNLCAYNSDPWLTYFCLKEKFPNTKIIVNWKLFRSFPMDKDIYQYDWELIKNAVRKIRIATQLNHPYISRWLYNRFLRQLSVSKSPLSLPLSVERSISITLTGNIVFYHNSDIVIGSLRNTVEEIKTKLRTTRLERLSKACIFCRHNDICNKSPGLSDMKDKKGNFVSCIDFYLPFFDIVKKELQNLSLPIIQNDIIWYNKQEQFAKEQVQNFLNEGKRYQVEQTRLPLHR